MATRAKQLLKNYIRPRKNIDINDIKEIKKNKDITKMINIINDRISDKYDFRYGLLFYYENVFVYYKHFQYELYDFEHFFLYDKENNCLMIYTSSVHYHKYLLLNNINIIKLYYDNNLAEVYIYKNKKSPFLYSYEYFGKIINDKYKANYRLLYICFV